MNKKTIVGTLALFMFLLIGIQTVIAQTSALDLLKDITKSVSGGGNGVTTAPSAKDLLKEGDNYFNQGNYDKAIETYQSILDLYPKSKEANDAKKKLADPKMQKPILTNPPTEADSEFIAQQYDPESDFQIDWDKNVKGGIIIAKYIGTKTEISIPPSIQNNPVTGIGKNAFQSNRRITKVTIPNGVKSIGNDAFSGCERLTSVNIPDGVTEIGWRVFLACESLTSIIIPNIKEFALFT